MNEPGERLRLFIDADVLIAAAASPSTQAASKVLLKLGEMTIVTCLISERVKTEAIRNVRKKVPRAEDKLRALMDVSLSVVDDPPQEVLARYEGQADPKDVPHLAAAVENRCRYLVTFNTRDYYPDKSQLTVLKPGELVEAIRSIVAGLG